MEDNPINVIFTKVAEQLLLGETGLYKFSFPYPPCVGDTVTIRTNPGEKILSFVCVSRRFDFSERSNHFLEVTLDNPST